MSNEQREKLVGIVSIIALAFMVTIGIVEREQQARTSENTRNNYSVSDQFANMRDTCIKAYVEHDESMQAACTATVTGYLSDGETNGGAK